ncbi:MAG: 3D domain-containing protein [Petrotogales bacterium]
MEAENAEVHLLKSELEVKDGIISSYDASNSKNLTITAYTAREQETNSNPEQTATMEKPVPGWTVAVSQDLKGWLGKRIYIEGLGVFKVNDLMNGRYTNRVDILKPTVAQANKFGKQKREVVLVEPYKEK